MLLQEVIEQYAKKLTIKLNIDTLREEDVRDLKETLHCENGVHPLQFEVYEMEDQVKVELSSRKQKVNITNELLTQLAEKEVIFKLN